MPGLGSHVNVADAVADQVYPDDGEDLFRLLTQQRPAYLMGSLGPDIPLFAPDFGNWSAELLRFFTRYYDLVVSPFEDFYRGVIQPISAEVEKIAADIDEAFLCGLITSVSSEVDRLVDGLETLGSTVFVSLFKDVVNVFDEMTPPLQKGEDEEQWFWFDVLHYRKTGRLIEEMWNLADSDPKRAFVLGWVTHYASDVIGHQTVNALVGGPYRSHNQRHHFIENLLDVQLCDELRDEEYIDSYAHNRLPQGQIVETTSPISTILDAPNDIPDELRPIFEMLVDAMRVTYDSPPQRLPGGFLDEEQLNGAYHYALLALKVSTSGALPFPPDPSEDVLDHINDVMQDFLDVATNPPQSPPNPPDLCFSFWDPDCSFDLAQLEEWADFLWDSVSYAAELLEWLGENLAVLVRRGVCTMTAFTTALIKATMWLAHAAIFDITTTLREGLVLAAIMPPDRDWVASHPIAQSSLDVSQNPSFSATEYPRKGAGTNEGFLSYPGTAVEDLRTVAAPQELFVDPTGFVDRATEDQRLYSEFATSPDPARTRDLEANNLDTAFASVRSMSLGIMRRLARHENGVPLDQATRKILADWNLDADRGYGYLNWTYEGIGSPPPPWNRPEGAVADRWAPD